MLLLGKGNAAEETFPTARGELRVLFGVRAAPGFPGCAPLTTELGRARQIKSCSDKFWRSWSKHRSLSCLVLGCSPLLRPRHLLSTAGQEEIPAAIPAGAARDGPSTWRQVLLQTAQLAGSALAPCPWQHSEHKEVQGVNLFPRQPEKIADFRGVWGARAGLGSPFVRCCPSHVGMWGLSRRGGQRAFGREFEQQRAWDFLKFFFPLHLCPLDSGRNGLRPGFDVLKQTVPSPPPPVPKL